MSSIVYLNGAFTPLEQATISINDRGFQFADGVYEVIYFRNHHLIDPHYHFERLYRSCLEMALSCPAQKEIESIGDDLIKRNGLSEGFVYLQLTRGVWPRIHQYPTEPISPTLLMTVKPKQTPDDLNKYGVKVITTQDLRWKRCDIKSISLLPNIMAKEKAVHCGAKEAFLVDDKGYITEGSSTNAWIVNQNGHLQTRFLDQFILPGTLRRALIEHIIPSLGYSLKEKPFTVDQLEGAVEVFYTSTTQWVVPVIQVNDKIIGQGTPGSIAQALFNAYESRVNKLTHL